MRYGILVPNFGTACGSANGLAELAVESEEAGWDGFFIFDHILYSNNQPVPLVDPWVALAAISMKTRRVRIGTMATPIPRRHPWKLARETVSIDHLSAGRLILAVALGDPPEVEFATFGETTDNRIRAGKLDEGLDVLAGLWSGVPFTYQGKYYTIKNARFLPRSFQSPRIPIWITGRWPRRAPFLRAAKWDGVFPLGLASGSKLSAVELGNVMAFIRKHRTENSPYDLVATSGAEGYTDDAALSAYAAAGVTWWMKDLRRWCNSRDELVGQIRKKPKGPVVRST